jgi:hypothetical protein
MVHLVDMALKRYQTDRRLFLWIWLVLFVVPWFIPIGEDNPEMPVMGWVYVFTHPIDILGDLYFIGMFGLLFGVPATVFGWVLHCIIVIARDAIRKRTHDVG